MKFILTLIFIAFLFGPNWAYGLDGRIKGGVYTSPGRLFQVEVPVMRNPFVKKPTNVVDVQEPSGTEEVTFAVPDLGEAWRYGVIPITTSSQEKHTTMVEISNQQLLKWLQTPSKPHVVLEDTIQLEDGLGSLRVYYQDNASLLFKKNGTVAKREGAIIGVIVAISDIKKQALFMIGQFDMPMSQLRFFIEDVKMPREEVFEMFAEDHAKRLRDLVTSFRLL